MPDSGTRTPVLGLTFTSDAAMNSNLLRLERALATVRGIVTTSITTPTQCVPGDGFIQGGLFCVALDAGSPNQLIDAQITGVADVKKATSGSHAYAPGDPVLVDENAHASTAGTTRIGTAVAVSDGPTGTVRTLLQPGLA